MQHRHDQWGTLASGFLLRRSAVYRPYLDLCQSFNMVITDLYAVKMQIIHRLLLHTVRECYHDEPKTNALSSSEIQRKRQATVYRIATGCFTLRKSVSVLSFPWTAETTHQENDLLPDFTK